MSVVLWVLTFAASSGRLSSVLFGGILRNLFTTNPTSISGRKCKTSRPNTEHQPGNGTDPEEFRDIIWRYCNDLQDLGLRALDLSGYTFESISSGLLAAEFLHRLTTEWERSSQLTFDIHSRKQSLTMAAMEMRRILKERHMQRAALPPEPAVPADLGALTWRLLCKFIHSSCSSATGSNIARLIQAAWPAFAADDPDAAWLLDQLANMETAVPVLTEVTCCRETVLYRQIEKAGQSLKTCPGRSWL